MERQVQVESHRMMSSQFSVDFEDLTDGEMMKMMTANAKAEEERKRMDQQPKGGISQQISWCSRSADVSNDDIQRDIHDQKLKQATTVDSGQRKLVREQSPPHFTCAVCSVSIAGKEWFMSGNSKHCSIRCAEKTAHKYIQFLADKEHEVLEGDEPRDLFATLL